MGKTVWKEKKAADERLRTKRFEEQGAALRASGAEEKDATFGMAAANFLGFLCSLPFCAAAVLLYVFCAEVTVLPLPALVSILLFLAAWILCVFVHEGLHYLAWGIVNRSFKGLHIRFSWTAAYCSCEIPMRKGKYLCGTAAPFLFLGVGICCAGILTGELFFFLLGVFNMIGAGGDLLLLFRGIFVRRDAVLLDHPVRCGFVCFLPGRDSVGTDGKKRGERSKRGTLPEEKD